MILAVAILLALVLFSGLEVADFRRTLERFSFSAILLILVFTAVQVGLSTIKWLIALRVSACGRKEAAVPSPAAAHHFTVLGVLLGQVLPVHVSTVLTRTAAIARDGGRRDMGRAAAASVYEQGFDAFIAALAFPAGLVFLLGGGGTWSLVTLGATLLLGGVAAIGFARRLLAVLTGWLGAVNGGWARHVAAAASAIANSELLRPNVLAATFTLSLLRFASLGARLVVIWWVLLPDLPVAVFLATAAVVQGALLAAVTPGGLGLAEAGWTGLLVLSAVPLDEALFFALAVRLTVVVSLAVLAGTSTLLMVTFGRLRRSMRPSDNPGAIGKANG